MNRCFLFFPLFLYLSLFLLLLPGRVRMVVGGSGGSKISTAVASVIRNHLWFGQNIKDAIDMSRIHHQLVPEYVEAEGWFPKGLLQ